MHVSVPKVRCNLSWKRAAMNISFISQFLLPRIKSDHRWHHRLENVHPGIEGNVFVAEKPSVRVEGIGSIMQTEILLRVFDVESKQPSHLCPEAASKTCPDLFGFWFLPFFWLRLRRHSFDTFLYIILIQFCINQQMWQKSKSHLWSRHLIMEYHCRQLSCTCSHHLFFANRNTHEKTWNSELIPAPCWHWLACSRRPSLKDNIGRQQVWFKLLNPWCSLG